MCKRKYTHIQKLFHEIETMICEGKCTEKKKHYKQGHHCRASLLDLTIAQRESHFCGIFWNSQEGSEIKGKVYRNLSSPGKVTCASYADSLKCPEAVITAMAIGWPVPKRMLSLLKRSGSNAFISTIPTDEAVAERLQKGLPQSQNNSAWHTKIRLTGWNPPL